MDKFRAQSAKFGTKIVTETITQIDLSERPFKYWREGEESNEPETADTLIVAQPRVQPCNHYLLM